MKAPHLSKARWRQEIAALPLPENAKRVLVKTVALILSGKCDLLLSTEEHRELEKVGVYYLWVHDGRREGKKYGYLLSNSRRRRQFKKEVEMPEQEDLLPNTEWPVEECEAYRQTMAVSGIETQEGQ